MPTRRGFNTLIGNGWLREAPKNIWNRGWDITSRSALKKCVFMPIPPDAKAFLDQLPPSVPPPVVATPSPPGGVAHRPATPPYRRGDPNKNAVAFPAVTPEQIHAHKRKQLHAAAQAKLLGKEEPRELGPNDSFSIAPIAGLPSTSARQWYEDPVALGTLLIVMPPIGLAALWSSKRYSSDARWALTVMTGLMFSLVAAVVVALTALHPS